MLWSQTPQTQYLDTLSFGCAFGLGLGLGLGLGPGHGKRLARGWNTLFLCGPRRSGSSLRLFTLGHSWRCGGNSAFLTTEVACASVFLITTPHYSFARLCKGIVIIIPNLIVNIPCSRGIHRCRRTSLIGTTQLRVFHLDLYYGLCCCSFNPCFY